jgi:hypothetical protein
MNEKKLDIDRHIEKGIEIYNQNVGLRYVINQIPIVGFFIDNFFGKTGAEIQERRLMQTIQFLHELTDKIDKTKVDYDFLESEEFTDLIVKIFQNSVKTRHKDKILLNCKILAGSILTENRDIRHSAEDLLVLVSELSPTDLKIASEIYEQQKDKPAKFDFEKGYGELNFITEKGWDNVQRFCKLDDSDFRLGLTKLSNAGLIKEVVGMYSGYEGGKYIITSTFQKLMSIIAYFEEPIFVTKLDSWKDENLNASNGSNGSNG